MEETEHTLIWNRSMNTVSKLLPIYQQTLVVTSNKIASKITNKRTTPVHIAVISVTIFFSSYFSQTHYRKKEEKNYI